MSRAGKKAQIKVKYPTLDNGPSKSKKVVPHLVFSSGLKRAYGTIRQDLIRKIVSDSKLGHPQLLEAIHEKFPEIQVAVLTLLEMSTIEQGYDYDVVAITQICSQPEASEKVVLLNRWRIFTNRDEKFRLEAAVKILLTLLSKDDDYLAKALESCKAVSYLENYCCRPEIRSSKIDSGLVKQWVTK
jgi:hypothetical protein